METLSWRRWDRREGYTTRPECVRRVITPYATYPQADHHKAEEMARSGGSSARMEIFKKQRLVSFSFFVNTDKFQGAAISDWGKYSPKYQLHLKPYIGPIGWVDVRVVPKNSTLHRDFVCWFNKAMREETNIHACWRHGSYDWEAGETPIGEKVRHSFIKVKVTAVYLVTCRGDRAGAEEALSCLKSGTGNVLEWYDATPEGKWTALLNPNISADTIVVPPVSARQ